ncbi:amidase [Deinococcota bacterium DY0809b]
METAADLVRDYARSVRDPVRETERVLERLEPGPVVAVRTGERALAAARKSAERYAAGRPLGPLDGVPVLVKDLLDVAGAVTAAGSAVLARLREPATADAAAVQKLERAGAVVVGKSQLNELAFSGLGLNPHFGTPANALNPDWVPGGSSSGSAVAVARGLVPLAVGTDTGGSVRIPAAFNGLVGFKPSWGRVSTRGVTPLAVSLDTVGPLAHTVEDAWAFFLALAGEPHRPLALPAAPPRLLVPDDLLERARPEVQDAFERALAALEAAGARLERRPLSALAEVYELYRRYGSLAAHEAYARWRGLLEVHGEAMDPRVVRRVLAVAGRPSVDHVQLRRERARRVPAFWAGLVGTDALVLPTAPVPPPTRAEVEASEEAFFRANDRVLAYTMLFNFYAGPAVSLPLAPGLGLMLAAAPGRDAALLALARWVEAQGALGTMDA